MAAIEIGIVVPKSWAQNYYKRGGSTGDLREALETMFPEYVFSTGLIGQEPNETLEVMQINRTGEHIGQRLSMETANDVRNAVIAFFEPTQKPAN